MGLREHKMKKILKCISPVDGSVFAQRETLDTEQAQEAVKYSRKAQIEWAKRPLQERIDLVTRRSI